MRTFLRSLLVPTALAAFAVAANASVTLYYADATTGVPLVTLPITSTGATVAVYYTSTTTITDSEVFASYDTSTISGTGATPIGKKVSLTSPVGAPGVAINMPQAAGGTDTTAAPAGTVRPYGLDILSVSAASGLLPATATGARLFTVTLNNLGLGLGQTTTLSFNTATGTINTTQFLDGNADPVSVTGSSLILTNAAPVPEPGTVAALGLGALAMLRRRKRA